MSQAVPQNLHELRLLFAQKPSDRIRLNMVMATTHSERVSCVEEAIEWIGQEHTKTRQHRQNRGEDALTTDIITDMKAMGFEASHDKDYGGHGDIVVECRDQFLWIGEAKIHNSYDWLFKGFQQLDTRYSTGLPGQEDGGLIIFCRGPRADEVMKTWTEHLKEQRPDVEINLVEGQPLMRRSQHVHSATGRLFKVKHIPISLYFEPKDKQPRKPRAKRASVKKRIAA